jgi:hypothetical protein
MSPQLTPPTPGKCPGCHGFLGDLEPDETAHPICAWATPRDWRALRPYFGGDLLAQGVRLGSE